MYIAHTRGHANTGTSVPLGHACTVVICGSAWVRRRYRHCCCRRRRDVLCCHTLTAMIYRRVSAHIYIGQTCHDTFTHNCGGTSRREITYGIFGITSPIYECASSSSCASASLCVCVRVSRLGSCERRIHSSSRLLIHDKAGFVPYFTKVQHKSRRARLEMYMLKLMCIRIVRGSLTSAAFHCDSNFNCFWFIRLLLRVIKWPVLMFNWIQPTQSIGFMYTASFWNIIDTRLEWLSSANEW